ncbi:transcriptional regulator HU subunit alpha [Candidatus Francisella endociliophora]|uniref:Transcriptional regulator HU subunit alpha n=1 Tax=Candidatus Francisella endociliophora TaxID=653937 RepID=A0A097ERL1_9GAMM|nr:HU family DNA-binding protein [Francisella sp. FSC1006]AIT10211.1 transcriptional regulator HU subunit alpha [Francisella sp. FSC1006]
MNKSELVSFMATEAGVTKGDALNLLDAFIDGVSSALKSGDSVTLVGFGTFQVKERSAREGRNPKTGETIKIAASKVPSFKAGKGLKDAVK